MNIATTEKTIKSIVYFSDGSLIATVKSGLTWKINDNYVQVFNYP